MYDDDELTLIFMFLFASNLSEPPQSLFQSCQAVSRFKLNENEMINAFYFAILLRYLSYMLSNEIKLNSRNQNEIKPIQFIETLWSSIITILLS